MLSNESYKRQTAHLEHAAPEPGVKNVHDSYVVDEHNTPVTVVGTYGQDPDHKPKVPWKSWAVLGLCALAQMQNTYWGIAPAANAYAIAGALNGTTSERIWIVQAQGVPSIVTGPILAIISDVYGRRYVVIGVWLLFCVAAIVSMTANNMSQLIAGQVLSGIGGGVSGIMYAIAGEVLPSTYRAHSQSVVNVVSSIASVIALLAMGTATSNDPVNGWRWVWRTLLIYNGLLLIGFTALYHPPPRTLAKTSLWEKVRSLDWIGYLLLVAGLVPLLMGFAWSSDSTYGWQSAHAYGPVAVGFVGLIATCVYEWKGTKTGFLDHRLFQNGRNFPLCLFLISVEGALFYLMNNLYPSETNAIWAPAGSIQASAQLLPFFLVILVVAPIMSYYVTKRKDIKWPLCAGFLFFITCVFGFAFSGQNGKMATAFNAIGGIGFSAPLILLLTMAQLSAPPLFIGVVSALTISVRTLGGTIGYAIAEAIYASKTDSQIPEAIIAATVPLGFDPTYLGALIGFLSSGQGLDAIPGITGQIIGAASAAMKETQAYGYKITWLAFLPGPIIAAVGCAFLVNPKERMNWVVDAPLKIKPTEGAGHAEAGASSAGEEEKR